MITILSSCNRTHDFHLRNPLLLFERYSVLLGFNDFFLIEQLGRVTASFFWVMHDIIPSREVLFYANVIRSLLALNYFARCEIDIVSSPFFQYPTCLL